MIWITGATSTIGKAACRLLHAQQIPFRAGVHKKNRDEIISYTPDIVEVDFNDPESIRQASSGVHAVLFIPPPAPEMTAMTNNLLAASGARGAPCIVKISAYGEDDGSLSRLGSWHRASDEALRASGFPFVLLHCMPFMQNIYYLVETMIKPYQSIFLPCGDARVSHIDAQDIASAACAILKSPEKHTSKEYVLTGGEALSYGQIAAILTEETGKKIEYRDISEQEAAQMLKKIGLPDQIIEAKLTSFRLEKKNLRSYISQHIKEITGTEPKPFREFVRKSINSLQQSLKD